MGKLQANREYFNVSIEPFTDDDGEVFIEFTGGIPTRQVTRVGSAWMTSRRDFHPAAGPLLTDQPLQVGEFDSRDVITSERFEEIWSFAVEQEDSAGD